MKKKDVENNNLSNVYDLTCPQCGAAMDYNREAHTVTCSYCGHKEIVDEDDIVQIEQEAYAKQMGKLKANNKNSKGCLIAGTVIFVICVLPFLVIFVVAMIQAFKEIFSGSDPTQIVSIFSQFREILTFVNHLKFV